MIRQRTTKLPFRTAWALLFISLLVQVGLYFGFHAISVPGLTPADQTRAAILSQAPISFYTMDFDTADPPDLLLQSQTSWLLHSSADNWFRSVLLAFAIILILLIVMAISTAIFRQN